MTPTTFAAFTVTLVDPETDPEVAVMVEEPSPWAVSSPEVVTVAMEADEELQVTLEVRSRVELSE